MNSCCVYGDISSMWLYIIGLRSERIIRNNGEADFVFNATRVNCFRDFYMKITSHWVSKYEVITQIEILEFCYCYKFERISGEVSV